VRLRDERRVELPRRFVEVATPFGPVTLKVATLPTGEERAMPEFDSVHEAVARTGAPHHEVASAAVRTYHSRPAGS
jgi:uncharacterized protein (DUF111 family)